MGLLYKGFQSLAYTGLEKARKKGLEVDKQRIKNDRDKRDMEFRDNIGINWGYLNKTWNDAMDKDD